MKDPEVYKHLVMAAESAHVAQEQCVTAMQAMALLASTLENNCSVLRVIVPSLPAEDRILVDGSDALVKSWAAIAISLRDARDVLARGFLAAMPKCYCGKCDRDKQLARLRETLGVINSEAMS